MFLYRWTDIKAHSDKWCNQTFFISFELFFSKLNINTMSNYPARDDIAQNSGPANVEQQFDQAAAKRREFAVSYSLAFAKMP